VKFIALDYLHGRSQAFFHAFSKRLSRIASVDQHTLNSLQARCASVDCLQRTHTVGHIGRCHCDGMRESLAIHGNVPFDARDFFARVVALQLRTVGILHTLRIND